MNKTYFYTVISAEYGIIHLLNYNQIPSLLSKLKTDKIKLDTAGIWWSLENPGSLIRAYIIYLYLLLRFQNIKFALLCNTQQEERNIRFLKWFGLHIIYCNQNCFIDYNIYTIQNERKKIYDALYNARMSSWKNHYLAANIDHIALIGYGMDNKAYVKKLNKILKKITWLNFEDGDYKFLAPSEIVDSINQSYCTLALSDLEGAMYASGESLLCGVPVVSIKSKGGRDVFFDETNSIIVEKCEESISQAVTEIKLSDRYVAKKIRKETIDKFKSHLNRYFVLINSLTPEKFNIEDHWVCVYVDKLRNVGGVNDIARSLKISQGNFNR